LKERKININVYFDTKFDKEIKIMFSSFLLILSGKKIDQQEELSPIYDLVTTIYFCFTFLLLSKERRVLKIRG